MLGPLSPEGPSHTPGCTCKLSKAGVVPRQAGSLAALGFSSASPSGTWESHASHKRWDDKGEERVWKGSYGAPKLSLRKAWFLLGLGAQPNGSRRRGSSPLSPQQETCPVSPPPLPSPWGNRELAKSTSS